MRRKSERTVKNSPAKRTETTNRRSTRRGKKSPEKSVNDEESEHSSDQATSESEAGEVIAPKRKRSSRMESSSTEEVKATTTTRGRRKAANKKEIETIEENPIETIEENPIDQTEDEPKESSSIDDTVAERPESTSVDTTNEPVDENQMETESNSVVQSTEETIASETLTTTTEDANEAKNSVDEVSESALPIEPIKLDQVNEDITEQINVAPAKEKPIRSRSFKRSEKQIVCDDVVSDTGEQKISSNQNQENESECNEIKLEKQQSEDTENSNEEKKSFDEDKKSDSNESNDNNGPQNEQENAVNAIDTTAKDTISSETTSTEKINKKKPIVRKRKWLSNKNSAPKIQEIAISTDSLKGLISDVKPVPLSDVQLDSSPEIDHESDDVKVVSSTSLDYNRRSEERVCESTDDINTLSISTTRKISIVSESEEAQPISPAKHNPSNILYITNLVRPFTVLQLKSLLQRTGKIAEDGFWIDKIKSKCYVKYETEE